MLHAVTVTLVRLKYFAWLTIPVFFLHLYVGVQVLRYPNFFLGEWEQIET